jgi:8-hydroxy-5-deazaflavin:NADPH oxidoreductase
MAYLKLNYNNMKIGLLGGTKLTKTLGEKYIEAGLQVVFGVNHDFDTESLEWKKLNRLHNRICPYESAIIQSEIILICSGNGQLPEIVSVLKNVDTEDKIIMDCTEDDFQSDLPGSSLELIKNAAPKSSIFKAFNTLGIDYSGHKKTKSPMEIIFSGANIPEKIRVKRLIELIGFKAVDSEKVNTKSLLESISDFGKEIIANRKRNTVTQNLRV